MDQVSMNQVLLFWYGASNLLPCYNLLLGYEESSASGLSYRLRDGTSRIEEEEE